MKSFLITYDLRGHTKNHIELYNEIKSCGKWQHPLESAWVVKVEGRESAMDIYNKLRPKIEDCDFLFVVDISNKDYSGWLSKNFWEWFKQS